MENRPITEQLPEYMVKEFEKVLEKCEDPSGNNVLSIASLCRKDIDTLEKEDSKALIIHYLLMHLPISLQSMILEAHQKIVAVGRVTIIQEFLKRKPELKKLLDIIKNE